MIRKNGMWTMEEALVVIRELQPIARQHHQHLALAGGVLNNNYSYNDLDIVVMPLHEAGTTPFDMEQNANNFMETLRRKFDVDLFEKTAGEYILTGPGRRIFAFKYHGKDVDLFVYGV